MFGRIETAEPCITGRSSSISAPTHHRRSTLKSVLVRRYATSWWYQRPHMTGGACGNPHLIGFLHIWTLKVTDPLIQTRTHMHVRRAEHHDARG